MEKVVNEVSGGTPHGVKEEAKMFPIPELDGPSAVFGDIKWVPKREALPDEYRENWSSDRNPYCRAMSMWFYKGAERDGEALVVDGQKFTPKPGLDARKALIAIKCLLGSYAPKHEHKIGAAGWLLSQWFDHDARPKATLAR